MSFLRHCFVLQSVCALPHRHVGALFSLPLVLSWSVCLPVCLSLSLILCFSLSPPLSRRILEKALSHPDEIWGVSPSPSDPSLLVTCSNGAKAGQNDGGVGFKVSFPFYCRKLAPMPLVLAAVT